MVGHKTSLNKFKKIENMSSIFSDHNGLKLETNLKEKTPKHSNTQRPNNMLLSNEWVNNEIKEEIKKYLGTNENEHTTTQNLCNTAKEVLRRTIQDCLKKTEKSHINNLTLHLQELEEQQQTKPRASRRKEIIKIRAELNYIETKITIQRISKFRSWFLKR